MNILKVIDRIEIDKMDDSVITFTTGEFSSNFPYPSITIFKGESEKYGKGFAVAVDYDKGLEIWSEDIKNEGIIEKICLEIIEYTKVFYFPKKVDLSTNWEEFEGFIDQFTKKSNFVYVFQQFEKYEFINYEFIETFKESLLKLEVIRDSLINLLFNEDNLYNVEIKSSGKELMISVDIHKYSDIVIKLKSELEKRAVWIILRVMLEYIVYESFEQNIASIVSNGMMKIDLSTKSSKELKEKFSIINDFLNINESKIMEIYSKISGVNEIIDRYMKYEIKFGINHDMNSLEVLDILIIDYIKTGNESIINQIGNFTSKILVNKNK